MEGYWMAERSRSNTSLLMLRTAVFVIDVNIFITNVAPPPIPRTSRPGRGGGNRWSNQSSCRSCSSLYGSCHFKTLQCTRFFSPLEAGRWKLVSRAATDRLPRGGGASYWELIAAHYFTILPANKQAFCRSAFRHESRHLQKKYVVWVAQGHQGLERPVSSPSAMSPQ